MRSRVVIFWLIGLTVAPVTARAQDDPSPWMLMSDGVLFATYNRQGSERGGDEFKSTNWWMGMASRTAGPGKLTLTGMLSLDALTATSHGYREIFQVGEVYQGAPLVDWQHPHDFLMQASIAWRVPIDYRSGFTIAGAPVGEAALGPVAYMHRASAADNPTAPLAHHTLDSTHISMGVVTAGLDHGPWTIEGSLFNGTEPDENRWDLMDPGPLDSWSARLWYEPSPEMAVSGVTWLSETSRSARARIDPPNHRFCVVDEATANRFHRRDLRVRPESEGSRRLHRVSGGG